MRRWGCLLGVLLWAGCTCTRPDLGGERFACASAADCLDGFECLDGVCATAPSTGGGAGGVGGGAGVGGGDACLPGGVAAACEAVGAECGALKVTDACGAPRTVACGDCQAPSTCGGDAIRNRCGGRALCRDGWCWERPRPTGNPLYELCLLGPTDAWAVGEGGTALRWDGEAWHPSLTNDNVSWNDVWGLSSDDVWAATETGLAHWDGTAWSRNGLPTGDLLAVWGIARDDVWAVGYGGKALHYDGAVWRDVPTPTTKALTSIWAGEGTSVWVVGESQVALQWVNGAWRQFSVSASGGWLSGVWGVDDTHLWAAGDRTVFTWDGTVWTPMAKQPADLSEAGIVWGTGPDDLWVAGDGGPFHWDGSMWTAPILPLENMWYALRGQGDTLIAVGTNGAIARSVSGVWAAEGGVSYASLYATYGFENSDVWAVGQWGTALRRGTDGAWAAVDTNTYAHLYAVWGADKDDVWMGGEEGTLRHWRGSSLETVQVAGPSDNIYDIHGLGSDDVWAVGDKRLAMHWDGARWTRHVIDAMATDAELLSVWPVSAREVWVAGLTGGASVFLHWVNDTWTTVPAPNTQEFVTPERLWGSDRDDIWGVTRNGDLIHWDGRLWTKTAAGLHSPLWGLWGLGAGEVYVVGNGVTARVAGNTASVLYPPTQTPLYGVWGTRSDGLWAVGEGGIILRRQPP